MVEAALKALEDRVHSAAASIVDPETGRHADIFVRRAGDDSLILKTSGSPAFTRELERRLELAEGAIQNSRPDGAVAAAEARPRLYLAHASEDHDTLARPLAEKLMAAGVEVWLDGWEIRTGDSLKRKMEVGLADTTHFLVLLTPNSIGKAWVEREIDVGFVRAVNGRSRFLGLRIGVPVGQLSEFLQTLACPSVNLDDDSQVADIVSDIFGVTRKPPLGEAPRYVKTLPEGLEQWSKATALVAEHLVRTSVGGMPLDPQTDAKRTSAATGLSENEVRLAVLDLEDAGLIERSRTSSSETFWPRPALFVEFDRHFLPFDNRKDAVALANHLMNVEQCQVLVSRLAEVFPDWSPRRINSALHYLQGMKAIDCRTTLNSRPFVTRSIFATDRTRRFVRSHS